MYVAMAILPFDRRAPSRRGLLSLSKLLAEELLILAQEAAFALALLFDLALAGSAFGRSLALLGLQSPGQGALIALDLALAGGLLVLPRFLL